ncbi:hypothetical protein [Nitriliruptor alkaliphilus]|uniref:hypothetical protein n=1 Tax=Nitriliruptor alkaliphilus TaxID=427918 RepID=UPI0006969E00|nr:hypothetical protein [Nitriliruptor alkaliphilus]
MLVPPLAVGGAAGQPMVMVLRQLLIMFWLAIVGLGVVVHFTFRDGTETTDGSVAWALLAVGGLMSLAGAGVARRRPLACGEPGALAAQYRVTFFIGVAFAEMAALLGFVAAFTISAAWPYYVGLVTSAIAFSLFIPTRSRLAAVDRELQARGCPHSLRAALYASPDDESGAPPPS